MGAKLKVQKIALDSLNDSLFYKIYITNKSKYT